MNSQVIEILGILIIGFALVAFASNNAQLQIQSFQATGLALQTLQENIASSEVSVLILAPSKNPKYNTPTTPTTLSGTATGINKISKVVWQNNRAGNGTADGTTNWKIPKLRLYHGMNEITITAIDAIGKTAKDTITIYFKDVITPSIRFSPANEAASNLQVKGIYKIAFKVSDNSEITKVELFIDEILTQTDTTEPFAFDWNTAKYKNVTHSIAAKAYDKANNAGTTKKLSLIVSN